MHPAPVGTRIRVLRNDNNHSYTIGGVYTIVHDDLDGTFKAADDETGQVGNWLRWSECEPASPSAWSMIAQDLPEQLVHFLSCFDGIGTIAVKEKVIDAVIAELPDLHERIASIVAAPIGRMLVSGNLPRPPAKEPSA